MFVIIILVFFLGISVGSFLNVLIDRVPTDQSVIKGRSYCDSCKKNLKWYDLIPIFSFVILRARCRNCHSSISFYYPLVEITTGFMFVLVFLLFFNHGIMNYELGITNIINIFYYFFIVSALIVIFFIDLKYGIIPDKILYSAVFISILYLIINSILRFHSGQEFLILNSMLSALGAFVFFLLIFIVTKGNGMGFGDVKLSFLIGLVLGFPKIIIGLYAAFLTGALISLILVVWGKKKFIGGTVPFGPFLVIGTLLAIFYGKNLQDLLLSFLIR